VQRLAEDVGGVAVEDRSQLFMPVGSGPPVEVRAVRIPDEGMSVIQPPRSPRR
jgi:hypothetical protein